MFFFPIGTQSASVFYISLLFLAVALVFSSPHRRLSESLSYLRLSPKQKELPALVGWGALALVASCLTAALLSLILSYFGMLDTEPVQAKILTLSLPALIAAFTLAPFAEEALFRGLLFRKISEWRMGGKKKQELGAAAGALLSSAIFSALHYSYGSVAEIAAAFLIGLLFCWFTRRTNSLIPAIVVHLSFNFLSIFFAVWFP